MEAILERITDAFIALDREWRFRYLNSEAERLIMRTRDELLNQVIWDEFPEAVQSSFYKRFHDAMEIGEAIEFQDQYLPLGRWFEVKAYPSAEGLSVFFRDVSRIHEGESQLQRSESRLHLAMEAASMGSFEWDLSNNVVQWSPAIEEMHGIPVGSFDGTLEMFMRDVHPDDISYVQSELKRSRESALHHNLAYRIVRADGEVRWLHAHGQYEVDASGVPLRLVGVCRDITEERASHDRVRMLSEAIPNQVWTARPDGTLDHVNQQVVEYFGADISLILGHGWTRFVHPDDAVSSGSRWRECLRTGEDYDMEFRLLRADGAWRWHLARAVAVRDSRGVIERWFGANTDVDDRKSAEEARDEALADVRAAQRSLLAAFEQAPAAIALSDGADHVTVVHNRLSREMAGGVDLTGLPLRDALPELRDSRYAHLLDAVYATGDAFIGSEMPVEFVDDDTGRPVLTYLNVVYQPLKDASNSVTGILTHSVDVTAQVRAVQELEAKAIELERLANALERSNEELDQFAYVASHDLKAPLRGIANLAQWIEEDAGALLPNEPREHIRMLQGRVRRMEALINGILSYSRAGRVRSTPEEVDTGELVKEVIDMLSSDVSIHVEMQGSFPVVITERIPLQQVFLNLVSNAVKFTAAYRGDGRVLVECTSVGNGQVSFRVSDNGPGIATEYHERIWAIFQTLEARDKVEGTGIGLSVVKKVVESRSGTVQLVSEAGEGTTFSFTWPDHREVEN